MHCPRCQRENRSQAKFCEECGAPLARSCEHCGAVLSTTGLGDLGLTVAANLITAWPYHDLADYHHAMALLRWNVAALDGERRDQRFGLPILPSVESRALPAWCLGWQGEFAEAVDLVDEATEIARTVGHPGTLVSAGSGAGVLHAMRGDARVAVPVLEDGMAWRRALHAVSPAGLSFLGWAYTLAGRIAEALPLFKESLDLAAAIKFLPCNAIYITWWGEACLAAERPEEAAQHGLQALEMARAQKAQGYEAHALRLLGEIAVRCPRADAARAEAYYGQARSLAELLGMRPLVAHCHLGLGKLYRRPGDHVKAHEHLMTASAMYREMGMGFWLAQAEAACAGR